MVERVTEAGGLGDDIVGAEMTSRRCLQKLMLMNLFVVVVTVEREEAVVNKSLMPSRGKDEELVLDVAVERDEAVVNKLFMPSGGNDDELVIDVAVERDEAVMIVSAEVAGGENASRQLVDDSTGDDA